MRARGPWREARLVTVDVETTGLNPELDRVISFGAVPIVRGRIVSGDAVYGLVNPQRDLPAESIVIHGIRPQDLSKNTGARGPETAGRDRSGGGDNRPPACRVG